MRKLYMFILMMAIASFSLQAQVDRYWEVGLMFNGLAYRGDLTFQEVNTKEISVGFGFSGRYYFNPVFAVRGNLGLGSLKGDDTFNEKRFNRGFSFETSLVELSFFAEYEPFGMSRIMKNGPKIFKYASPYFFLGTGLAFTNPQPVFPNRIDVGGFGPIEQDMRAGYSNVHLVIPMGGGIKITLDREWTLALELGARTPFTDYLDGISISANPDKNDWYWSGGVIMIYRLE